MLKWTGFQHRFCIHFLSTSHLSLEIMFKPNREFQAGLDTETVRRQRQKAALSLRRQDRQIKLQNKRKKLLQKSGASNLLNPSPSGTVPPFGGRVEQQQQQMLQSLPKYVEGCFTEHKSTIFECTQKIRELLSLSKEPEAPIKDVVDSGVVPRIIQFLRWKQCPELQFEAMWVLTNIASSDRPEFTAKVVRDGAITAMIEILQSPSYRLQEQAVWALGQSLSRWTVSISFHSISISLHFVHSLVLCE